MPAPKRVDVEDFYAQLPEVARPHLGQLRELCRTTLPDAEEVLHWNQPAFVQGGTRLLMLQAYDRHCSLRFPTSFFAGQRDRVEAVGYESGEGFVKLPYDVGLPVDVLRALVEARRLDFETGGADW